MNKELLNGLSSNLMWSTDPLNTGIMQSKSEFVIPCEKFESQESLFLFLNHQQLITSFGSFKK